MDKVCSQDDYFSAVTTLSTGVTYIVALLSEFIVIILPPNKSSIKYVTTSRDFLLPLKSTFSLANTPDVGLILILSD